MAQTPDIFVFKPGDRVHLIGDKDRKFEIVESPFGDPSLHRVKVKDASGQCYDAPVVQICRDSGAARAGE